MAGGYHEDAWAQGCKCTDPFYISHWHLIDTFVYFSHSFVTIPPPGWINSAHTHDVQVHAPILCGTLYSACKGSIISYDLAGTVLYFTHNCVSIPTPGWIKASA